jgi:NADPH:quinone reductase-like Zn-dependent oxidoreductase
MKAATFSRYGTPEVVTIAEYPNPVARPREVLVRIRATTVSSGDARIRGLRMPPGFGWAARPAFGFFGPRQPILGTEFAGDVVAVGAEVSTFAMGDRVFGFPGIEMKCHAEFRTMPADGRIRHMPENLTYEQAAALSFGGSTALHFLHTVAKLQAGDRVLVIGASGALGSAAVQIARAAGAHVTGVTSGKNAELVAQLGAQSVIDYTKTDPFQGGGEWNIIFDAVGGLTFSKCETSLCAGGKLILSVAGPGEMLGSLWAARGTGKRVIIGSGGERREYLDTLADLVSSGDFLPVIGQTFPFSDIQKAHAYVDTGRKVGSAVVVLPE